MLRVLSLLPLPLLQALLAPLARLLWLVGWRRGFVHEGLARCLPEVDASQRRRLARDFYTYLGRLVAEVVHGARIEAPDLERRLRFEDDEVVRAALASGKRVLLLAGHHCNWEWLLLRCSSAFGEPLTAAYKPASREAPDRWLRELRSRYGAAMVPARDLVQHLIERRGAVRLLAMVADQSPSAKNEQQVWLPFFGQDTAFFQGPGWIAAKMGYLPVFVALRPDGRGRYVARFVPLAAAGERLAPEPLLRAYVGALEEQVRAFPAQYFWAYNRWKRAKRLYD
jgi:KDO2-lipid IV(A) lauroyltransferase